jgi:hypothetical protein
MEPSGTPQVETPLWSDDPAETDLLGFTAVAETVVDAVLNDSIDPIALGLSGRWGSGKTTVLYLVQSILSKASRDDAKILIGNNPSRIR